MKTIDVPENILISAYWPPKDENDVPVGYGVQKTHLVLQMSLSSFTFVRITLQSVNNERVSGLGARNRYFAVYHLDAAQLHIQQIGSTRMMCSEPAMALESAYFAALEQVETYQLREEHLTLYCDHGKTILLFTT